MPDKAVQRAIADFLDRETGRIDTLVAKKGRLVELLEQKTQAVIDLVARGRVPEGRERRSVSAPWIGNIPEGWDVMPLRFLLAMPITDGPHETPDFVDDGVAFISAESIQDLEIDFSRKRGYITPDANAMYSRKYSPQLGDIYMVKSGATTGKTAMVRQRVDFNIWSPLAVLRPSDRIRGEYLLLLLRSRMVQDAVALSWSWGTQQNIGMDALGRIQVPVPPRREQDQLLAFSDQQTAVIRGTVERVKASVGKLRELRSALITAAVTGQIDPATWGRRGETERALAGVGGLS
jgi:type I restriction enzyme S subunit